MTEGIFQDFSQSGVEKLLGWLGNKPSTLYLNSQACSYDLSDREKFVQMVLLWSLISNFVLSLQILFFPLKR